MATCDDYPGLFFPDDDGNFDWDRPGWGDDTYEDSTSGRNNNSNIIRTPQLVSDMSIDEIKTLLIEEGILELNIDSTKYTIYTRMKRVGQKILLFVFIEGLNKMGITGLGMPDYIGTIFTDNYCMNARYFPTKKSPKDTQHSGFNQSPIAKIHGDMSRFASVLNMYGSISVKEIPIEV